MNCFKHKGNFPCQQCNQEQYDRCVMENGQRIGTEIPLHDLTELRKKLNISWQEPTNKIVSSEFFDGDDTKKKIELHNKLRFGE